MARSDECQSNCIRHRCVADQGRPANKAAYEANATALNAEIDALDKEIAATVAPVADKPFVVFHDAYQYFEKRYNIRVAGSVTVSPESMPGAERLSRFMRKFRNWAPPACSPSRNSSRSSSMWSPKVHRPDPVHWIPRVVRLTEGPALYGQLMRNLSTSIADCLSH